MFWNISNHPSSDWGSEQMVAAEAMGGEVRDIPFPNVHPNASEQDVEDMTWDVFQITDRKSGDYALIQGEFTLAFDLVRRFQKLGVVCVAATTERVSEEKDGVKTSVFRFVQFREYSRIEE